MLTMHILVHVFQESLFAKSFKMIDKSLMDACAYLFTYFTKMKYSYKSDAKMTKGNWKCFKKILPNLFRTKSLVWKKIICTNVSAFTSVLNIF